VCEPILSSASWRPIFKFVTTPPPESRCLAYFCDGVRIKLTAPGDPMERDRAALRRELDEGYVTDSSAYE
jgi:hypothetical protein